LMHSIHGNTMKFCARFNEHVCIDDICPKLCNIKISGVQAETGAGTTTTTTTPITRCPSEMTIIDMHETDWSLPSFSSPATLVKRNCFDFSVKHYDRCRSIVDFRICNYPGESEESVPGRDTSSLRPDLDWNFKSAKHQFVEPIAKNLELVQVEYADLAGLLNQHVCALPQVASKLDASRATSFCDSHGLQLMPVQMTTMIWVWTILMWRQTRAVHLPDSQTVVVQNLSAERLTTTTAQTTIHPEMRDSSAGSTTQSPLVSDKTPPRHSEPHSEVPRFGDLGLPGWVWTLAGLAMSAIGGAARKPLLRSVHLLLPHLPWTTVALRQLLRVLRWGAKLTDALQDVLPSAHEDVQDEEPLTEDPLEVPKAPEREASQSRSPTRVSCPKCERSMKAPRDMYVCTGYPLCQGAIAKSQMPLRILPDQALQEAPLTPEFPNPSAPEFPKPKHPSSWWSPPPPPPPPVTLIGGPTLPPAPPVKSPPPPRTPPTRAPPVPKSPESVTVDLGGTLPRFCGRRQDLSPPRRAFQEDKDTLTQLQKEESNRLYQIALRNACPQCRRHDKLNHQGSSHIIQNLRCSRCDLRIATKWR
jgi:ssDNA-binding Zn-finger/Zn-ribbon topoisomerase 1